ncbi:MAG: class F sortase [Caldilineaceae bacterium]
MFYRAILATMLMIGVAACQPTAAADAPVGMTHDTTITATTVLTETIPMDATTFTVKSATPVDSATAQPPLRLVMPALDLAIPVEPMGWRVSEVEGERQAVWELPENSAGWHMNSALAGAAGNMIVSGHHQIGAAVFAPLARGEVTVGEQILVTDAGGKSFLYTVTTVADPIPDLGASAAEVQRAEEFLAPTTEPRLTLMTGWPEFSDTHYLFIVADFTGTLQ